MEKAIAENILRDVVGNVTDFDKMMRERETGRREDMADHCNAKSGKSESGRALTRTEKMIGRMLEIINGDQEEELKKLVAKQADGTASSRDAERLARVQELVDAQYEATGKFIDSLGNYRYLMAMDMGCGNVSVSILKIGASDLTAFDQLVRWRREPRVYNKDQGAYIPVTVTGNVSIPTILGYKRDVADPVIGEEAFYYGKVAQNFKWVPTEGYLNSRPYSFIGPVASPSVRQIWISYMDEAYKRALKYVENVKTEDKESGEMLPVFPGIDNKNILFIVGRPASPAWKKHLPEYKEMITVATGLEPEQILTFSEAKASMQYVRRYKGRKIDWQKGALVIDLGASTIDIMFLAYGHKMKEWSITMAGRDADDLLAHQVLSEYFSDEMEGLAVNDVPDEAFFSQHDSEFGCDKDEFMHRIRMAKEAACKSSKAATVNIIIDGIAKDIPVNKKDIQAILDSREFDVTYDYERLAMYMQKQNGQPTGTLVASGSWYSHFGNFLSFVLGELGPGVQVDQLIATGGSANLVGIESCIRDRLQSANWGETGIVIMNEESDYEATVPAGSISYTNTVISKIQNFKEFPQKLDRVLKSELLTDATIEKISDLIEEAVKPKVKEAFDIWAGSLLDLSFADLEFFLKGVRIDDSTRKDLSNNASEIICKAELKNVQSCNKDFLKDISVDHNYSQTPKATEVKIHISDDLIGKCVESGLQEVTWDWLLKGFFNMAKSFWAIFFKKLSVKNSAPLSKKEREGVAENYFMFFGDIDFEKFTREALEAEYEKTNGFGMIDQILDDIELDINQAMFMG